MAALACSAPCAQLPSSAVLLGCHPRLHVRIHWLRIDTSLERAEARAMLQLTYLQSYEQVHRRAVHPSMQTSQSLSQWPPNQCPYATHTVRACTRADTRRLPANAPCAPGCRLVSTLPTLPTPPTARVLPPTTYYPLPTTHCLLTTYYLQTTTYYLLPTAYYLLPTTCYQLPTTHYLPPTTH